jgi:hypothetical protein
VSLAVSVVSNCDQSWHKLLSRELGVHRDGLFFALTVFHYHGHDDVTALARSLHSSLRVCGWLSRFSSAWLMRSPERSTLCFQGSPDVDARSGRRVSG